MNDKIYNAYTELANILNNLNAEKKKMFSKINDITKRIKAVEMAMREIKPISNGKKMPPSSIDLVERLRGIRNGITHQEALIKVVNAIGDERKIFRVREAIKIMVNAGLFTNPNNADSIIYTIIDRSGRFKKIEPGIYKLIEKENKDNLFNNSEPSIFMK